LQAVSVNALRGYKRAVVPLVINAVGMWLVGLGGGIALGLTMLPTRFGFAGPLGVNGFWIGAATGMGVATIGIIIYFLIVSAPGHARARTAAIATS
jgi:Na+-driven multidrug efflux pump